MTEALLLQRAVEERAALATSPGADEAVRCSVKVHDGRDHNLVVEMRDSGELHDWLCQLVAAEGAEGGAAAGVEEALPAKFVGFEDCPDF